MRGSKKFILFYTLFAFGDIKNRKQDNNTLRCEEENKMDKLMMNKLDDMELDMVAGGAIKGGPADSDSAFSSLGRAMNNAVVDGGKAVGNAVDRMLYKVFGPPRRR